MKTKQKVQIAAAPELLEAAKSMVKLFSSVGNLYESDEDGGDAFGYAKDLEQLRAAIAKAEGRV